MAAADNTQQWLWNLSQYWCFSTEAKKNRTTRGWHTLQNLVPETCTSFWASFMLSFTFSLIHISYNGTECSCIWQKKLACTDHNCAVWFVGSARLYLQLASSIVFIVSRVCFGSFWYQKLPWIYVTPITQQKFITLSDIKPITGCTMSTLYCNGMPQPLQAIMKNAMAGASIQCSDKTQKLLSMI